MPDVILLCRHVASGDQPALETRLEAVAERLRETLEAQEIDVAVVLHAPTSISGAHARWLAARLQGDPSPEADTALDPTLASSWKRKDVDQFLGSALGRLRAARAGEGRHRAVLIVGHRPQLGYIAHRLLRNRPGWRMVADGGVASLPLKHAELASIVLEADYNGRPAGRLDWTVAPDETAAIEAIQAKIRSKMETAKLLGAFITLVLGGVLLAPGRLRELGDDEAVGVAAIAFLLAIGFYLRTLYAYDSLLMPGRFWDDGAPGEHRPRWLVRRPPSSAAWVLYQNMIHIWNCFFTPATIAVLVGLALLAYAALDPSVWEALVTVVVFVAAAAYAWRRRPVLGSQD